MMSGALLVRSIVFIAHHLCMCCVVEPNPCLCLQNFLWSVDPWRPPPDMPRGEAMEMSERLFDRVQELEKKVRWARALCYSSVVLPAFPPAHHPSFPPALLPAHHPSFLPIFLPVYHPSFPPVLLQLADALDDNTRLRQRNQELISTLHAPPNSSSIQLPGALLAPLSSGAEAGGGKPGSRRTSQAQY